VKPERIGLLGGTFDPVHLGHIELAKAALSECRLDRVVFIPAAHPPHKNGARVLNFAHRLAMLRLAMENHQQFSCCSIEARLPPPTYTIDTLHALRRTCPSGDFFFIIGSDAFLDLLSWKSYREILGLVELVLAQRAGSDHQEICAFLAKIGYSSRDGNWQGRGRLKTVTLLKTIPVPISSSTIRELLNKGKATEEFLPELVQAYIHAHRLYRIPQKGDRETEEGSLYG
jgi:nicotinate-nucleotide adenylyltransferase